MFVPYSGVPAILEDKHIDPTSFKRIVGHILGDVSMVGATMLMNGPTGLISFVISSDGSYASPAFTEIGTYTLTPLIEDVVLDESSKEVVVVETGVDQIITLDFTAHSTYYEIEIDTTREDMLGGSSPFEFNFGLKGSNSFEWWDSDGGHGFFDSVETYGNQSTEYVYQFHFATPGIKTIKIKGSGESPQHRLTYVFMRHADKLKLMNIKNWGRMSWSSFETSYYGCSDMDITAKDVPNLEYPSVMVMLSAFGACASVKSCDTSAWDMSKVTTIRGVFQSCTQWDVKHANWDTSNFGNSDYALYYTATSDVKISNWSIENMFSFAHAFRGLTIPPEEMDAIYNNWSNQNVKPDQAVIFDSNKYTAAGAAGRMKLITDFNWTITDGGQV